MKKIERLFIYSGVGLAIALGLGWHGIGTVASAHTELAADNVRIATADVLTLVEKLASSDRYLPARTEKMNALRAPIEQLQKELDELRAKITAMPDFQNNAEAQPEIQKFQQKTPNLQAMQPTAQSEAESFNTTQLQEAYKAVVDACNQVANSKGYTHVFASKSAESKMASANVAGLLQEMLARPVIKSNPADDITEDVVKELKLENVKPAAAAPAAATPTPAPAPAGGK